MIHYQHPILSRRCCPYGVACAALGILLLFSALDVPFARADTLLSPTDTVTVPAGGTAGPTTGDIVVRERSDDTTQNLHISAFLNFQTSSIASFDPAAGDKAYFGVDFQGRLNTVNAVPLYVGQVTGGSWSTSSLPSYNWATASGLTVGPGSQTRQQTVVPDVKNNGLNFYAADVTNTVDAWVSGAESNYGLGVYTGNNNQGAGFGNPQLHIVQARELPALPMLIDDLDNSALGSGGLNGGFSKVSNNVPSAGSGNVNESGTYVGLATSGSNNNVGIVSDGTFDPTTDAASGFTVTWQVLKAENPQANGVNLTLQSNPGFISNAAGQPNLLFRFDHVDDNTFHLRAHNGTAELDLATDPITMSEVLDGFTLTATFNDTGWSYAATGLPSLAANSGSWSGDHTYATLFDSTTHVGAFIQGSGSQQMVVDRFEVEANQRDFLVGGFDDFTAKGNTAGAVPVDSDLIRDLTPVSWIDVAGTTNTAYKTGDLGVTPQSGVGFAQFTAGANGDDCGIAQTFSTLAGETYEVSFYLGRNTSNRAPTIDVDVFAGTDGRDTTGSGTLADESYFINWEQDTWQLQTFTFTAASELTTIRFLEPSTSNTVSVGPVLDTIQISLVPEPSTLCLAVLGLVGLIGFRRRKR
jgi:hypothetical protein